jgi:phosphatidylserine/phosphatidylglycerophosphate/cardiolipin synthase-like enzyme
MRAVRASLLASALIALCVGFGSIASASTALSGVTHVWTEPVSGYGFLDSAILAAHHSIDMSMYELADTVVEHDLIAKAAAGVDVRVLLDSDFNGARDNASSYALLHASAVHVEWAPPNQIFHAKYVVIDGVRAFIGTGNLASRDYSSTRDFWVEDTTPSDVSGVASTFDNDFNHGAVPARASDGLVWSPGSTAALVDLIGSARHTLFVENEEMDSAPIEQALDAAAARGVSVKVVMTSSSDSAVALRGLASDGVHVRVLGASQIYIHAKVICADCGAGTGTVFIGSENFSTSSLSYNRELGLITKTSSAVAAVWHAVTADYALGTTLSGTVTSTPPPTSSSGAVAITSFVATISRGAEDSLRVHSRKANDTCTLRVVLPSGYVSESHGLGALRANGAGNAMWTWEIGPDTGPGTAHATITCGAGTVSRSFTIT